MKGKISSLEIHNFRGVRLLRLRPDGQHLIITGENGSGKSSIIDALEYAFTGKVRKLSGRRDVEERRGIPHLGGGKTRVEFRFQESGHVVSVAYPRGVLALPAAVSRLLAQASGHPFVLRRDQILEFISARPSARYQQISSIVGLKPLDEVDSAWHKALRNASKEVEKRAEEIEAEYGRLGNLLYTPIGGPDDLLAAVNASLRDGGLAPISARPELAARIQTIASQLRSGAEHALVQQLRGLEVELKALPAVLTAFLDRQEAMLRLRAEFWQKSAVLADARWEQLLVAGLGQLEADGGWLHCPLCQEPVADSGALREHLAERVTGLGTLTTLRREISQATGELHRSLANTCERAEELAVALNLQQINADALLLAVSYLRALEPALQEDELSAETNALWRDAAPLRALDAAWAPIRVAVARRRAEVSPAEEEQPLFELHTRLAKVADAWQGLERRWAHLASALRMAEQLTLVCDELAAARRRGLERMRHELEDEIERLYNMIHPNEGYSGIRLQPQREQRSSVDLTARFQGRDPAHPLTHWSEGHLDSLGLCIFLAFIKRYNPGFGLIILDDVLTTVDAGHRLRVAGLLAKEFADYQLIVTTHDQMWANQLHAALPASQLLCLRPWELERGVAAWDHPLGDWAYYREVAGARPLDAIAGAGRNLEQFLYTMSANLRLAIPFRPQGDYSIGDMMPPFFAWCASHRVERPDRPTFAGDLADIKQQLEAIWRLRNWSGAHFNPWGATATAAEARSFIDVVASLVELFSCPACQMLVAREGDALRCPMCAPGAPARFISGYDSGWHGRAERMLRQPEAAARGHLRHMVPAIVLGFLKDMRLQLGLEVVATLDGEYRASALFKAFVEFVTTAPPPGYDAGEIRSRARAIAAFRVDGDWRAVADGELAAFVGSAHDLICPFTCASCEGLLGYDAERGCYTCRSCIAQTGLTSAYWFIA
jgi:hypothetical protein